MTTLIKAYALKATFALMCFYYGIVVLILSCGYNTSKKTNIRLESSTHLTQFQNLSDQIDSVFNIEAELRRRLELASEKKFILLWHRPFWYRINEGWKCNRERCGNCELTMDRSKITNQNTGAVLFPLVNFRDKNMPNSSTRNPNQLHVLWQSEPPTHFKPEVINCEYAFNATASYRRFSDFFENGQLQSIQVTKKRNISKSFIMKRKTKLALSIISNCQSNPGATARIKIIRRMQDLGFAIDGYGRCFKNSSLPKQKNIEKTVNLYKFYMSFENSYHCRDYITEKAFNKGLKYLAVPVLWGATKEDYATVMPKGSYIYAEDFETLESLVDYLNYLNNNDTAYLRYFDWYRSELPPQSIPGIGRLCQICRAIHGINYDDRHRPDYDPLNPRIPTFTNGIARRAAPSIKSFIYGEENEECLEKAAKWNFYKRWKL